MYWKGVKKTLGSIRNLYAPIGAAIVGVFLLTYLTTKDLLLSLTFFNNGE